MDFETILTIVGSLMGGGGIVALLTIPELRKAKRLENDGTALSQYKELLEKYEQDLDDARKELTELRKRCDRLSDECGSLRTQISTLRTMYDHANVFRCNALNCPNRQPPLNEGKLREVVGIESAPNSAI